MFLASSCVGWTDSLQPRTYFFDHRQLVRTTPPLYVSNLARLRLASSSTYFGTSSSILYSLNLSSISSSSFDSPLCLSIIPSLFHSRLKTYLFHKFYPRIFTSSRSAFVAPSAAAEVRGPSLEVSPGSRSRVGWARPPLVREAQGPYFRTSRRRADPGDPSAPF